jgi:hypothetical protein
MFQCVTGGEVSLVKIFNISLKVGIHVLCESFTIAQCSTMGKRYSYRTEQFIWAEG